MKRFFIIFIILVFNLTLFSQQSSLTPSYLSKAKYVNYFTKIPAPSIYRDHNSLSKIQTLNISANYIGAWPSEAQNAFNYALNIWSYLIDSSIPIKIKAEWVPLGEGILAETNSTSYKKNFTNAPVADVNFPVSLAEALSGTELNGSEEEINIRVSSDFSWYYGVDGNTPSEKHDLVSVILHEVTHGLGFTHSMQVENNIGSWGQNYPNINEKGFAQYYETFGVVGPNSTTIYRLTNTNQYPNPSGELANALQSINVYFDGTITKQMYLNSLPKLYAPNPFEGGSTLAHFDEDTFPAGNQNSSMSPQLGMAESIHSPGELGLAVLQDLGWNVNRLITILSPKAGLAYMPGQNKEIKWTDNIGGAISIDLLKKDSFGNYQYYSTIASHPSPRGVSNSINWTIPNVEGTFRIRMIDNTFSGEGFGLSYPFIISNQAQVATPVILPAGGNFLTAQTIIISCVTTGATIYYTTDNSEPSSSNGTEYSTSFSINSDMIIKAIAIKSGFPDSEIKSETYTFGTMPPPATITPISGQYPVPLTIVVDWYSDVEGYVAYTNNGTEPIDPKTAGWSIPFNRPWSMTWSYPNYIIKINARTKKNGVWGPLVQRTYDLKPALRIAQIDDEITQGNNSFGQWNKWENNQWTPHPDETIVRPTQTSDWYVKALQDFKDPANNIFRKYNVWKVNGSDNYYVNHSKISVGSTTSLILAHFKQANNVTVTNKIDNVFSVNQGSFTFKNPWIVDDNSDSKGPRNRGAGTPDIPLFPYSINFSATPNITTSSIHKGVFLNQGGNDFTPPYYSIKVDAVQNLSLTNTGMPSGRNHKFYFQNWYGTNANFQNANALETPVVFTSDGATAQANLKGSQISSQTNAYDHNNQRKYIKSDDGFLHLVYESMGSVYYEISPNGTDWYIQNSGKPLSTTGKQPSIDFNTFYDPSDGETYYQTIVVWQEQYGTSSKVKAALFQRIFDSGFKTDLYDMVDVAVVSGSYTANDCTPVISFYAGSFKIVYKNGTTGALMCSRGFVNLYSGIYSLSSPVILTGTSSYSSNPSIVVNKTNGSTFLVWQQTQISITASINCASIQNAQISGSITNISSGSGSSFNFSPAISFANNKPIVSWTGGTYTGGYLINKKAITTVGTTWGSFNIAGTDVNYVNNNSASGTSEKTVIGWSEGITNPVTKWLRRDGTLYSTPHTLSNSGFQSQLCSGTNFQTMSAMVFKNTTIPYYFLKSTTDFSSNQEEGGGELTKITENDTIVTFGRSGVASINDIEFVFEIGDILVGDSIIRFIDIPDTLVYTLANQLNQHTKSNNFTLTPETNFYFSNIYYVVQKSDPDTSLIASDAVNFKAELVNANTNQVVGTFDNITYNKNNLEKYASIDYEVDCSGITPGDYYLRLVTNVNGNANYALANIISDNTTLAKKIFNKVNFTGSEIPITYDLAQNFPNPFNPSTTIRYQIPQDGIVTLKIYDILGAEVATLVNEEKVAGKYEVNFNASSLASGVYIYKIQAGSFINSKKMILLK